MVCHRNLTTSFVEYLIAKGRQIQFFIPLKMKGYCRKISYKIGYICQNCNDTLYADYCKRFEFNIGVQGTGMDVLTSVVLAIIYCDDFPVKYLGSERRVQSLLVDKIRH